MAILHTFCKIFLLVSITSLHLVFSELTPDFYDGVCPVALNTIKAIVEGAIAIDPRMGASLLRLHFHDCFVNGCDASILLDDTSTFIGEKTAGPNNNSLRGYEVIDEIKLALNTVCLGNVVSCADIIAVAARDSIVALGGFPYQVLLGRRDSTTASHDAANKHLPSPFLDLRGLIANFESHGLSLHDLVVLSGAHTVGSARCVIFRNRIYNDSTSIDPAFSDDLRVGCPISGEDDNLFGLDNSSLSFDTAYYCDLLQMKGLLHSDQQLFLGGGGEVEEMVRYYSENLEAFWDDFGEAMVRLGSLSPLMGSNEGVIREDCRVVNLD